MGVTSKLVEFVISVRLKNPLLIQPLPGANVTNSRKHKDDDYCVAKLTTHDLQYIKLYPLQMCLLMSPPLYRLYSWRTASVSFRKLRCEHLQSGTTNSFILQQMSPLATIAANVGIKAGKCKVLIFLT